MTTRRSCIKDIIGAVLFIIVGGVFLGQMSDLPENAAKYPSILIYIIFALCLALIAQAVGAIVSGRALTTEPVRVADDPLAEEPVKFGRATVIVLVLSFLYVLALPYIGFILASALLLVVFMLAVGVRSIPVLVLVPVCEIAFLWYVFEKLLSVYLPNADALRGWLGIG